MIDEIDELITNMQTLCNIADEDLVTEIATRSADILAELSAMLPPTLSRRITIEQADVEAGESYNTKFDPPLDLQPPEGKEAEWALLRLAKMVGVECKYETWDELASEISKRLKREDVAA